MRVFIGMPIEAALQEAVDGFRRTHPGLKVKWTKPENLHLTLVPPWECDECEPVCRMLKECAERYRPFQVRFDTVSPGPKGGRRRGRLIWATGRVPGGLVTLQRELAASGESAESPQREFLLHLTMARCKPLDAGELHTPGLTDFPVEWNGLLNSLALYHSILNPSGAEYHILCRYPLTGSL